MYLTTTTRRHSVAFTALTIGVLVLTSNVSEPSLALDTHAGFARTSCGCNDEPLLTISPTATPTLSGTATSGKTLTVRTTGWMAGLTFRYQWLRNGDPIAGATGSKYKLKTADKRKQVSVEVTASKRGYTAVTIASEPTRPVKNSIRRAMEKPSPR